MTSFDDMFDPDVHNTGYHRRKKKEKDPIEDFDNLDDLDNEEEDEDNL